MFFASTSLSLPGCVRLLSTPAGLPHAAAQSGADVLLQRLDNRRHDQWYQDVPVRDSNNERCRGGLAQKTGQQAAVLLLYDDSRHHVATWPVIERRIEWTLTGL